MYPKDFYEMVLKMAAEIGVPENHIILGGDHLGPLTWQNLPETEAMENPRLSYISMHVPDSPKSIWTPV